MTRYSWTQPSCGNCFEEMNPGRTPVVLKQPDHEICCHCGNETNEGIYVRVDPATVSRPTHEKED